MPMLTRLGVSGLWHSPKLSSGPSASFFQENTLKEYIKNTLLYATSPKAFNKDFMFNAFISTELFYEVHDEMLDFIIDNIVRWYPVLDDASIAFAPVSYALTITTDSHFLQPRVYVGMTYNYISLPFFKKNRTQKYAALQLINLSSFFLDLWAASADCIQQSRKSKKKKKKTLRIKK